MRVLWFTNSPCNFVQTGGTTYNGGGWMTSLQNELMKRDDIELGICFLKDGQEEKVVQQGVTYYPISISKKKFVDKVKGYLFYKDVSVEEPLWQYYIKHFKKVISDFKPDVIHAFGSELYPGLSVMASQVPCVLHIQGVINPYYDVLYPPSTSPIDKGWRRSGLLGMFKEYYADLWWRRDCYRERAIMNCTRHFIGRTDWDFRVSRIMSPKSSYHFGEEIMRGEFYHPCQRVLPDRLTITTVISAAQYKGYDLILKTANILKNVLSMDFIWNVYGNISPDYMENRFGLKHEHLNVRLCGIADAKTIMEAHSSATLYYHSSYIENGCNSIIEAQMCGCTPIANFVGGLPNTIKDKETGFLVPSNDAYQAAFLIKYLYDNPEANMTMGKNAQIDALKRHDPETIVSDLLKTYTDVINDSQINQQDIF